MPLYKPFFWLRDTTAGRRPKEAQEPHAMTDFIQPSGLDLKANALSIALQTDVEKAHPVKTIFHCGEGPCRHPGTVEPLPQ